MPQNAKVEAIEAEVPEKQKPPIVPLAGYKIDLRKALPLSIGDDEALENMGIDLRDLDAKRGYDLARYILKKAEPDLTDEEINRLPIQWSVRILSITSKMQQEVDLPF